MKLGEEILIELRIAQRAEHEKLDTGVERSVGIKLEISGVTEGPRALVHIVLLLWGSTETMGAAFQSIALPARSSYRSHAVGSAWRQQSIRSVLELIELWTPDA